MNRVWAWHYSTQLIYTPSNSYWWLKVELGSRAGALKQMLLDILEDTHEIRRICIMGRNCTLLKNDEMECSVPLEKEIVEGKLHKTLFILSWVTLIDKSHHIYSINLVLNICFVFRRGGGNRNAFGKLSTKVIPWHLSSHWEELHPWCASWHWYFRQTCPWPLFSNFFELRDYPNNHI